MLSDSEASQHFIYTGDSSLCNPECAGQNDDFKTEILPKEDLKFTMKNNCFLTFIFIVAHLAAYPNSLHSLVFDLSPDLRTTLPSDGWVKLSFTVTNYGETELNMKFRAVCVESGKELPSYPLNEIISLKPNEEQTITVFMNSECGKLDSLLAGHHSRNIEYTFIEENTHDTLSFEQQYVIEVPLRKEAPVNQIMGMLNSFRNQAAWKPQ